MAGNSAAERARTYVPRDDEGAVIADFVRVLDQAGVGGSAGRPALVAASGESLELPPAMFEALRQVAAALAAGKGVTVAPLSARLTTQEAADYLGISRPTLVRLLEQGEIPMDKPGRHRFVRLTDLIEYQERIRSNRHQELQTMVHQAEEEDLYEKTDRPAPSTR